MRISDWSSDVCSSDLPPGEAEHPARTGQLDQFDFARLPRLEAHGGAGRDVQAHTPRAVPIEAQRVVGLDEVVVRADLERPDRKSVVEGKRVSVRVDIGGRRIIKKKKNSTTTRQ